MLKCRSAQAAAAENMRENDSERETGRMGASELKERKRKLDYSTRPQPQLAVPQAAFSERDPKVLYGVFCTPQSKP